MRVILFQSRFAELVRSGTKKQTIRKRANCKPGDVLSLRTWIGKARQKGSYQEVLLESVCTEVLPTIITACGVEVDGVLTPAQHIAVADGFRDWEGMRDWFECTHGLPFTGELIRWR